MIASFISSRVIKSSGHPNFDRTQHELHVILFTGKTGMLKVGIIAYCGEQADAAKGVLQIDEHVFSTNSQVAIAKATAALRRLGIEISPVPCEKCAAMAGLSPT